MLQQAGIKVRAYDPQGMAGAEALFDGLSYAASALEAADGADVLCLVTHWPEFVSADLDAVRARLARPAMVDLRNVFDPASMKAAGWDYRSLGRPED